MTVYDSADMVGVTIGEGCANCPRCDSGEDTFVWAEDADAGLFRGVCVECGHKETEVLK